MGQSTEFVCPLCGSAMDIKLSRGGKFLSCSKFPECLGSLTIDGVEIKADEPIGTDPETGMSIYVKNGRFGPFVQLGEKTAKVKKPRMASIPKEVNPSEVTVEQALLYLSLPRTLVWSDSKSKYQTHAQSRCLDTKILNLSTSALLGASSLTLQEYIRATQSTRGIF